MPEPKNPEDENKQEEGQQDDLKKDSEEEQDEQGQGDQGDESEGGDQEAEGDEEDGDQGEEKSNEKPPSRRESLRIQKLISKLKQAGVEPESDTRTGGLNYKEALDADDKTLKTLEDDRTKYGDNRYSEGLKRAESIQFHTRLEIDAPRVEAKYPVFDKESPKFDPQIADAINTWYLATAGYDQKTGQVTNSNVRYADFVEGIMELSEGLAGEKVASAKKNITKQAAQTGLRPGGNSTKRMNLNQAPQNMSDEELDTIIAQAIPPKKR